MPITKDFKDCRVIIYDTEHKVHISETNILDYDKNTHSIFVAEKFFENMDIAILSLLILYDGHVYEYGGNLRKNAVGATREISLYKEKYKEDRHAIRYNVNAPAVIDSIFIAGREIKRQEVINTTVINVSTVGVLIQAPITAFNINTIFHLKLAVNQTMLDVKCKVKHIKNSDGKISQYGCEFLDKIKGED